MSNRISVDNVVEMPKAIRRFEYIDALRGFAVFIVIAYHTHQVAMPVYHKLTAFIAATGARGVQLFFLISAFTLCYSKTKRASSGETSSKSFYIRRYFRIAPMYYLGIIYFIFQSSLGSTFWVDDTIGVTLWNVIANLFFVNSVSPTWIGSIVPGGWSISVEFLFYFIFPFIFARVKTLASSLNFLFLCIILQSVMATLLHKYQLIANEERWIDYLFHYLVNQLPVFCLGIIGFQLIFKSDYDYKSVSKILLLLMVIVVIVCWKYVTLHHIFISIGFLILMILLSRGKFKFLVNQFSTYLGKVSYSAYLVHFSVLFFLGEFGFTRLFKTEDYFVSLLNFGIVLMGTLLITVILSTLTFKYIERPFIKIGQRLIVQK